MSGVSYLIVHLLALIGPGYLLVRATRIRAADGVFIPANGYIYYIFIAFFTKWLDLSLVTFLVIYVVLLLPLALLAFTRRSENFGKRLDSHWLVGLGLVSIAYLIYRYFVGPYSELPADLYHHMEYARIEFDALNDDQLGSSPSLKSLLNQRGGIWYSFYALITHLCGFELNQTIRWASLANGLIFLGVVYSFAWYIFGRAEISARARLTAAALAAFFVAAHMGINVFSYLRYYALAPTMLNMTIFFAAVIAIHELYEWQSKQFRLALYIVLGGLAAVVVHTQEVLFILIYSGMLLAWYALVPTRFVRQSAGHIADTSRWGYRLMLLLFVSGFIALVIWTYLNHDRPTDFFNKIIQASEQGPIFNRVLYLNPAYQGIQTITVWGLAVFALFAVYWRKFIHHPYLFSGMLIPFVTVFNPVFVDWFLRMDGVHTLWRSLYIVPIHFVAGLLVVYLYLSARHAESRMRRIVPYLGIVLLFALLLPIPGVNSNSRLTLTKTDADESFMYWQDLVDYLNDESVDTTFILTDPVTGYMLNGLTKHRSYQYKFLNRYTRRINFDDYDDGPLKRYKDWLLVINDRRGGHSETGGASRHWDAEVLNTSAFYSQALRQHIENNPEQRFSLRWQAPKIRVYQIQ